MENKLEEEDVKEYKKKYIQLLKEELSDMDFSSDEFLDDLYNGLQKLPDGFPHELASWHKDDLIYEFSKNYKPKKIKE